MSRKMSTGFRCDICKELLSSKYNLERHRGTSRCRKRAGLVEDTIIRVVAQEQDSESEQNEQVMLAVKHVTANSRTKTPFRRVVLSEFTNFKVKKYYAESNNNEILLTKAIADLISDLKVRYIGDNLEHKIKVRYGDTVLLDMSVSDLLLVSDQNTTINLHQLLFGVEAPCASFNVTVPLLSLTLEGNWRVWADLITLSEEERKRFIACGQEIFINQYQSVSRRVANIRLPITAVYRRCVGSIDEYDLVPREHSWYYSVSTGRVATTLDATTISCALYPKRYQFDTMDDVPYIIQYVTLLQQHNDKVYCYQDLTEPSLEERIYKNCCELYSEGKYNELNDLLDSSGFNSESTVRYGKLNELDVRFPKINMEQSTELKGKLTELYDKKILICQELLGEGGEVYGVRPGDYKNLFHINRQYMFLSDGVLVSFPGWIWWAYFEMGVVPSKEFIRLLDMVLQ